MQVSNGLRAENIRVCAWEAIAQCEVARTPCTACGRDLQQPNFADGLRVNILISAPIRVNRLECGQVQMAAAAQLLRHDIRVKPAA
jgi:hypothetical protein